MLTRAPLLLPALIHYLYPYSDIDAKFFKRDERERFSRGRLTDFPEKAGYAPDVVLEYVDEFGARLDSKEAFSELSYKFHGKMCGKAKVDKILRKRKLDLVCTPPDSRTESDSCLE